MGFIVLNPCVGVKYLPAYIHCRKSLRVVQYHLNLPTMGGIPLKGKSK